MKRCDVVINGRFLTQSLTGVQRYAFRILHALDDVLASSPARAVRWQFELHTPTNAAHTALNAIVRRDIGSRSGHLWEQIDLLHSARNKILINLGNSAPLLHRHQVIAIHDAAIYAMPDNFSLPFRMGYRAMYAALRQTSTKVITVSQFSRTELGRRAGFDPVAISLIPNAGDHFAPIEADPTILRKWGLRPNAYVFAIGTGSRLKNLRTLETAMTQLMDTDLLLAFAGTRPEHVFAANRAPQGGRIVNLGRVSDSELKALYNNALCLAFPSLYEGFGIPLIEAMTCGCPIIASDIPVVREICGANVLLCNPLSSEEFALAIRRLNDSVELRNIMRKGGQLRYQMYSWRRSAEDLPSIIDGLC